MAAKSLNLISSISLFLLLSQVLLSHATSDSDALSSSPLSYLNYLVGAQKGHKKEGIAQLRKHLTSIGYMKNDDKNVLNEEAYTKGDLFDDDLELAIRKYQTFFHLKANGILDSKTVEKLISPRCGVADLLTSNGNHLRKSKWPSTKRNLTYSFPTGTRKDVMNPIKEATQQWSNVTNFTFKYIENYDQADIKIGFQYRAHGDKETFDGISGTWAHGFGPNDGRIHYDGDEKLADTVAEGKLDMQTIGLHELGHVLGLGHTSDHDAIMYPIILHGTRKGLSKVDINGIRDLYKF